MLIAQAHFLGPPQQCNHRFIPLLACSGLQCPFDLDDPSYTIEKPHVDARRLVHLFHRDVPPQRLGHGKQTLVVRNA